MKITSMRLLASVALATGATLSLAACAGGTEGADSAEGATDAASAGSRVALTYDGGLFVLDGDTLELLADIELDGFNRLNSSGDGRHVLVSTAEGFQVLDTAEPELTDLVFDAPTPGHVVRHAERTILFSDGTGDTIIFDTDALLDADGELPETEVVGAPDAHHGVSIELEDGTLLTTIGDSESRTGVRVLDANREEIARSEECPSVHGEGTAANEVVVFGCSDGVLVYDGKFTKITAPDAYGRTGNAYVTETSPIMVGDYNADPDAEGYELTAVTLVDTVAKSAEVINLPSGVAYTWRGVARTADDNALILGTDGALHVLDVETGEITESFPVIDAWKGPVEWQHAHPALVVVGDIAYVTDPATNSIHAVDAATGEVLETGELPATPNEIAVVTG
ncbi:zinc metallochaperone AztD [Salinibacterium sp. SYSU T00001]|uniref:zinc metallochaperone AztD n=1 Tax=Homoserinimonas sedimenticola TaxID=2986805 RepID=UPI002235A396|nr:zinc metallochaperone AztD [Salinibacterium sedimenticola]MCW4386302.1 zinc metallochaperone AztD [Salinibacterium sedimenticola]